MHLFYHMFLWLAETFARGEALHTCIEQHLSGSPVSPVPDNVEAFWRSLDPVLPHFSDVRFLEQRVSHPHLGYTGYFDCVARYKYVGGGKERPGIGGRKWGNWGGWGKGGGLRCL